MAIDHSKQLVRWFIRIAVVSIDMAAVQLQGGYIECAYWGRAWEPWFSLDLAVSIRNLNQGSILSLNKNTFVMEILQLDAHVYCNTVHEGTKLADFPLHCTHCPTAAVVSKSRPRVLQTALLHCRTNKASKPKLHLHAAAGSITHIHNSHPPTARSRTNFPLPCEPHCRKNTPSTIVTSASDTLLRCNLRARLLHQGRVPHSIDTPGPPAPRPDQQPHQRAVLHRGHDDVRFPHGHQLGDLLVVSLTQIIDRKSRPKAPPRRVRSTQSVSRHLPAMKSNGRWCR